MVAYSNGMKLGTPAPPFSLRGVDDKHYSLDTFKDATLLVVVFTCNHCPYAKALEDRLIAFQRDYASRDVRLVAINSNDARAYPEDDFAHMVNRAKERGFNFPYLHDETQAVARAYDAACTPDIFLFDPARDLVYNGRFDDNWKEPNNVTRNDLRVVVDAALQGKTVDFEPVRSMGCSIKWKPA